ncbi:MAG: hypothetical protein ACPGYT_14735, partial [Nitrospirales bacterium]
EVEEAVLSALRAHESLTIEELIGLVPHFRRGEALKVLSQLLGENTLELENQQGQLKVLFVRQLETTRFIDGWKTKKSQNEQELTCS